MIESTKEVIESINDHDLTKNDRAFEKKRKCSLENILSQSTSFETRHINYSNISFFIL